MSDEGASMHFVILAPNTYIIQKQYSTPKVISEGLEPTATGLKDQRFDQLSYRIGTPERNLASSPAV